VPIAPIASLAFFLRNAKGAKDAKDAKAIDVFFNKKVEIGLFVFRKISAPNFYDETMKKIKNFFDFYEVMK
jgi:hypothetical protein